MENGPKAETGKNWPTNRKQRAVRFREKITQKWQKKKWDLGSFSMFWPFLGHFSPVSGRGPFSILRPIFPIFGFRPVFHSIPGGLTHSVCPWLHTYFCLLSCRLWDLHWQGHPVIKATRLAPSGCAGHANMAGNMWGWTAGSFSGTEAEWRVNLEPPPSISVKPLKPSGIARPQDHILITNQSCTWEARPRKTEGPSMEENDWQKPREMARGRDRERCKWV